MCWGQGRWTDANSVLEDKWAGLADGGRGCAGEGGVRNVFWVSGLTRRENGGGAIC